MDGRILKVLAIVTIAQILVFYDHFAVALTFVFAVALGLWMQRWAAGVYALASFVIAFVIAVAVGWLHDARPWELFLGGALALLGGAIAGGVFQLIRGERAVEAPATTAEPVGARPMSPPGEPA